MSNKQSPLTVLLICIMININTQQTIHFSSNQSWQDMKAGSKLIGRGMGRTKLFRFLRDNGLLMANNEPYQVYVNLGLFKLISKDIHDRRGKFLFNQNVTLISMEGIDHVIQLIDKTKPDLS
jgi:hypothetical protein